MKVPLKLVILYDGRANTYTIHGHNLTVEEAEKETVVLRDKQQLTAIAVDQLKRHRTADPERCRACRQSVERASGLEPKPSFKRKESA